MGGGPAHTDAVLSAASVHPEPERAWCDLRARADALGAGLASPPALASARPTCADAAAARVAAWLADVAAVDGGRDAALVAAASGLCASVAGLTGGGGDAAGPLPDAAPLDTFSRSTSKFFIRPHAAPALKLALAARLPLCLPGRLRLACRVAAEVTVVMRLSDVRGWARRGFINPPFLSSLYHVLRSGDVWERVGMPLPRQKHTNQPAPSLAPGAQRKHALTRRSHMT